MSSPLRGLTVWLAFVNAVKGGAARVVDELDALNVGAKLAFRLGDGGNYGEGYRDDSTMKLFVDRLTPERVAAWQYWRPGPLVKQIELFRRAYALGVRHLIVNAEVEFKFSGANSEARTHVDALRKAFPDARIDHAPFALLEWHGGSAGYPYDGFSKLDRVDLQIYPHEFGGKTPAQWIALMRAQLASYGGAHPDVAAQKLALVFDLYGSGLAKVWGQNPGPPAAWHDDDLATAIAAVREGEEMHVYSIDAALAEGAPWRALQAACAAIPPATSDDPCAPEHKATIDADVLDVLCVPDDEPSTT